MKAWVRDERGAAVTAWFVMMVTVIAAVLGIAVDLTGRLRLGGYAGEVAAQAARAGGQAVDIAAFRTRNPELVSGSAARAAARNVIEAAGMTGTMRYSGHQIHVEVVGHYRPVFLSAFGVGALKVTATAEAEIVEVRQGVRR